MKRLKCLVKKLGIKSTRTSFRVAGKYFPKHIGKVAVNIFITPKPYLRPFWERELLKRGQPVTLSSGRSVVAWGTPGNPGVMLIHGWEGRGSQLGKFVDPLLKSGFRVFAWDGPAHGSSPGTQTHIVQFARAILEDVNELGPLQGIVAHSFGASAAAFILSNPSKGRLKSKSIVLISSPASIGSVIDRYLKFIEMAPKGASAFRTILEKVVGVTIEEVEISEIVKRAKLPALIIHDAADLEVPYTEAQALAKNWPGAVFHTVFGLGHRKILKDPSVIKKSIEFISEQSPLDKENHMFKKLMKTASPRIHTPAQSLRFIFGFVISILVFQGCSVPLHKPVTLIDRSQLRELVIVSTNDFHAALNRAEDLANQIQALRTLYPKNLIHLDGGDLFQGSLEGDANKGKSIIEFYNFLQVDATAVGNHDLDYGPDNPKRMIPLAGEDPRGTLMQRSKEANFQWLSANWVWQSKRPAEKDRVNAEGRNTLFAPRAVFNKGDLKVCVIGATTPATYARTLPNFVVDTEFTALLPTVQAEIDWFNTHEKCDFKLLVTHAGLRCVKDGNCLKREETAEILALAEALPYAALDGIVAGHTHVRAQEIINGIPIIESGANGESIGTLHLFTPVVTPDGAPVTASVSSPDGRPNPNPAHPLPRVPPEFGPSIPVSENAINPAVSALLSSYPRKSKPYQKT